MENELLTELEQKIGYQFKDKGLQIGRAHV